MFSLSLIASLTPEEILSAFHADRRSKEDAILRDAVLRIAAFTLERALLGELSYQPALEALRAIGLSKAAEPTDGEIRIVLDDAAGRYSK